MLPYVVLHNAVSLDGRLDWFSPDIGQFYGLISRWKEDATLAGSDTILAATPETDTSETIEPPALNPQDTGPLLVINGSRGRLRNWGYWRKQPYWRDVIAICSHKTPENHLNYLREHYVKYIVAGEDKVDLQAALEELNRQYGVKTVRVDSGGSLNGTLLRAGLVNEVSLLIHPALVGGISPRSIFRASDLTSPDGVIQLELLNMERLTSDIVWLRYEVIKKR